MEDRQHIKITGKNPAFLSLYGEVNDKTATRLCNTISDAVSSGKDELHLLMSTPGGNVAWGVTCYNLILALEVRVVTYNIGCVGSIGNVIYQAGNWRICMPDANFAFHGTSVTNNGGRVDKFSLAEAGREIDSDEEQIERIYAKHIKSGDDGVKDLLSKEVFFNADESLERGITDEKRRILLPPRVQLMKTTD